MSFQYEPFVNPYAASMADEIARSGDAAARAAEIVGQAHARAAATKGAGWARAIENIGQLPAQISAQQHADTDRKLKEQQLSMTIEERQLAQAQRVATLTGRIAGVSHSPAEFAAALDRATSSGLLPAEIGAHVKQQLQAVGDDPAAFRAFRQQHIDFADQFQPTATLKGGETLGVRSVGGGFSPIASAPEIKEVPGGASLAAVTPGAPGQAPTAATLVTAPKLDVVNGQPMNITPTSATPIGTAVPKQEGASEVKVNEARVKELNAQVREVEAKLAGTIPMSPKDREELSLRRTQLQNELEHWHTIERNEDPQSPKNQERLEKDYRSVAQRVIMSRSGTLGVEDGKVAMAKHLITMFDQMKDPKSGEYNLSLVQSHELAMGLATLISRGGVPAQSDIAAIDQATAARDWAKLATYVTGSPVTGNSQAIFKNLRESIERQGLQAESNREKELDAIRAFAPTDLAANRRTNIEKGLAGLNRMQDVGVLPGGHHVGDPVTYQGKQYKIVGYENGHVTLEEVKP